jgi:neurotransmitter:Na+ symporter, NSS family
MTEQKHSIHGVWGSRWTFILAATGSAVGLGNIWKFPYITGENGGGAFVLVYLLCIALVGIPIMMAEVLLGRQGRQSPISTMAALVRDTGTPKVWQLLGWTGALAGFLILTYYSVIAGWSLNYIFEMASGSFSGKSGEQVAGTFDEMLANPKQLLLWHSLFILLVAAVASQGVIRGLEKAVRLLMPVLFALLILLVGYALSTDSFSRGVGFLFNVDFSKMSWEGALTALGHAFFTLSLGMGAIMVYGSYMPKNASIGGTVMMVAALDTVVALVAGLAIFPIVFSNGLEPGSGPGLMFIALPHAFGNMGFGQLFGVLFFVLVAFAAWSSAISLVEPAVAWVVERFGVRRGLAAVSLCFVAWFIGLGTVFSFNIWADVTLAGFDFFSGLDFLTANIMLPATGFFIALYVGWVLPQRLVVDELALRHSGWYSLWRFVLRFVAPLAVFIVFVVPLYGRFAG